MTDQASKVNQALGQSARSQRKHTRYLKQRSLVVGCLWLVLVVFSSHWVLTLIGTFFSLFLVFGIDDEIQALERDPHDPMEF